jgi:hypothetical protein
MAQPQNPICAEIRSKKYFRLTAPPQSSDDIVDNANDCWCNRTCDRVGPDGDGVHPDDCREGRSCFRSVLGARVS